MLTYNILIFIIIILFMRHTTHTTYTTPHTTTHNTTHHRHHNISRRLSTASLAFSDSYGCKRLASTVKLRPQPGHPSHASCSWTSYTSFADARSPSSNFLAPTAFCSPWYMARPLPFQRANSLSVIFFSFGIR